MPSRNPAGALDELVARDYTGWREVRLEVQHANGSIVDMQLLRPQEWIARNGMLIGATVDLRLTEIEVNASARVVAIVEGPDVEPGEGAVVTGRFATREAGDLVRVTLTGGVELVGTATHPVWSPLDWDWRGLGELEPGQLVETRHGLVAVERVERLTIRRPVYNIEVDGEHAYEVTELGVLVHNNAELCDRILRLRQNTSRTPADDALLRQLERQAGIRVPIQPNVEFDRAGRIRSSGATIRPENLYAGTGTTDAARALTTPDDAGHIIGRLLGGQGGATSNNIFPQLPAVNRGSFRQHEAWVAEQVRAGRTVEVRVELIYDNATTTRPERILYHTTIDGVSSTARFANN